MIGIRGLGCAVTIFLGTCGLTAAEPPSKLDPGVAVTELQTLAARMRPPQAFEMLWAVVQGSQMGPGDGWFKPSESRYSWEWLAKQQHIGLKDALTKDQFLGAPELFDRLDRNRDYVVRADDFDWSDRSMFLRQSMPPSQWFRMFDGDSNGKLTQAEWEALFQRASKGKGYLTSEDLREAFPTSPPARPPGQTPSAANQGPSKETLFYGLLKGELGSFCEGPPLEGMAPDFTLKTHDDKQRISLSDYRGKKPVVIIFGSFT